MNDILTLYRQCRAVSEALAEPLSPEDQTLQSMPDASPTKWHLAHTSWFFETLLLKVYGHNFQPFHPQFEYLFNSYYQSIGPQYSRPARGLISRPGVEEVMEYRAYVDRGMGELLESLAGRDKELSNDIIKLTTLGVHHEQQHQELILTDIKHALAQNPLFPPYRAAPDSVGLTDTSASPLQWISFDEGLYDIGSIGEGKGKGEDFCFDNEQPRHKHYLQSFRLASRPITNGEYCQFMDEGGYHNPLLWLFDGWSWVQSQQIKSPLYWQNIEGEWHYYTLAGLCPVNPAEPVTHVSYYEAQAYANWCGKRLATEQEWEVASQGLLVKERRQGMLDIERLHPQVADGTLVQSGLEQMFGDVWEWTQSPYSPYPGYQALPGAVGEYNGKFMCNQMVLRGGSCVTPVGHIRPGYRNFFIPSARWQFTGIRLAETV